MMDRIDAIYPLTPTQASLLFHSVAGKDSDPGYVPVSFEVQGDLDLDLLQRAFDTLAKRHSALRTSIQWEGIDEPVQVVHGNVSPSITVIDEQASKGDLSVIQDLADQERKAGFRLENPPLTRLAVLRLAPERYHVLWSIHHIVVDGWSAAILMEDLFRIYEQLATGNSVPEAIPPEAQFSEYAKWLRAADVEAALTYWRTRLQGFKPRSNSNRKLTQHRSGELLRGTVRLESDLKALLRAAKARFRITDNTLLLAAWSLCLADLNNALDIALGAAVSGRPEDLPFSKEIVGSITSTIPVRVQIKESRGLGQWVHDMQRDFQKASFYSFLAPDKIAACSSAPLGTRLFDSVIMVENYPEPQINNSRFALKNITSSVSTVHPLTIMWRPRQGELSIFLNGDFNTIDVGSIIRSLQERLLAIAESNFDEPVASLLRLTVPKIPTLSDEDFEASQSPTLGPPIDATERILLEVYEKVLGHDLATTDDFFDVGGNSLSAVQAVQQIELSLGRRIAAVNIARFPTVKSLAGFLRGSDDEDFDLLVTLFAGNDRPPLFAIPPGGDAVAFTEVAKHFSSRTFVGLQAQGLDGREPPLESIEDMASRYVEEILRFQPEGPYHFVTICGGGTVLLEIIHQLRQQDGSVGSFIIIDPSWIFPEHRYQNFKRRRTPSEKVLHASRLLISAEVWSILSRKVRLYFDRRRGRRLHMEEINALDPVRRRVVDAYYKAALEYEPRKVEGKMTAIVSKQWCDKLDFHNRIRRWEFLVDGGVDCRFIEASHYSMSLGEDAVVLADLIERLVKEEEERSADRMGNR